MSLGTLQGLMEDCMFFLMKELQLHQTILYGKILMAADTSLILETHTDGELVKNQV